MLSPFAVLLCVLLVVVIVIAVTSYLVGRRNAAACTLSTSSLRSSSLTGQTPMSPPCVVPIHGQSPFPPPGPPLAGVKPTSLLISTDVDFDDIMALIFLLMVPQVTIVGIVVSGNGMVPLPQGLTIVRRVLRLAGQENIPV